MWRNKIKEDSDIALKSGNKRLVGVLRYLLSILDKRELQLPKGEMSVTEEMAVLRKELKNKEEARDMFLKAQRADLVEDQDFEIEVLKKYLPAGMPEAEIEKIVDEVILEIGKDLSANRPIFGVVMGETMKRMAGRVGGEVVSKIVKEKLA
ncbi:MAG: GatB/YqeY domain-containing protein [Patescibacteria group bacterium]